MLVCPSCLTKSANRKGGFACAHCEKRFLLIEGLPSFTESTPLFEGRFVEYFRASRFEHTWFYIGEG